MTDNTSETSNDTTTTADPTPEVTATSADTTAAAPEQTVVEATPAPTTIPTPSVATDDNAIENAVWQWYKTACNDMQNWTLIHPYVWLKQEVHKLVAALKEL